MKKILYLFIAALFLLVACDSSNEICNECDGIFSETINIWVKEEYGPCQTDSTENCNYIQYNTTVVDTAWVLLESEICGFEFEAGYQYNLSIRKLKIGTDSNGDKIYKYCLREIVSKVKVYL